MEIAAPQSPKRLVMLGFQGLGRVKKQWSPLGQRTGHPCVKEEEGVEIQNGDLIASCCRKLGR